MASATGTNKLVRAISILTQTARKEALRLL